MWVTDQLSDSIERKKKGGGMFLGLSSQLGIFFEFADLFVWFIKGPIDKIEVIYDVKIEGERDALLYKYSTSEEPLIHSVVSEVHSKEILYTTLTYQF